MRLSVGARPGARAFFVAIAVVGFLMAACAASIGWVAGGVVERVLASGGVGDPAAPGDPTAAIGDGAGWAVTAFRASGLCALPIALFFAYLGLRALRYGAWLRGTTAVVRNALSTKSVDLSTAAVRGDSVSHTQTHGHYRYIYSVAALAARDPSSGVEIKIPLRGQGLKRLPANELYALADAMMSRRHPADPNHREAENIATALRQMAANPFPV
jgi:hypothetical protein